MTGSCKVSHRNSSGQAVDNNVTSSKILSVISEQASGQKKKKKKKRIYANNEQKKKIPRNRDWLLQDWPENWKWCNFVCEKKKYETFPGTRPLASPDCTPPPTLDCLWWKTRSGLEFGALDQKLREARQSARDVKNKVKEIRERADKWMLLTLVQWNFACERFLRHPDSGHSPPAVCDVIVEVSPNDQLLQEWTFAFMKVEKWRNESLLCLEIALQLTDLPLNDGCLSVSSPGKPEFKNWDFFSPTASSSLDVFCLWIFCALISEQKRSQI